MAKYRKKPVVIEATQWFKNGDHPKDGSKPIMTKNTNPDTFLSEGKIVKYYRHPDTNGETPCLKCGINMHEHGWVDTLEGGHIVCPKDYIITGVQGEIYPCKPDVFEQTYDLVRKFQTGLGKLLTSTKTKGEQLIRKIARSRGSG